MLRCLFAWITLTMTAFAASPVDGPIASVRLKNGTTLTNVTIVSFSEHVLMARWDGGRGTINYDQLPDSLRMELRPYISGGAISQKEAPSTPSSSNPARVAPPARERIGNPASDAESSPSNRVAVRDMSSTADSNPPHAFRTTVGLLLFCAVVGGIAATIVVSARIAAAKKRKRYAALMAKYHDTVVVDRIISKTVWVGESAEQLRDSFGPPIDIDHKVLKTKSKEVWKYVRKGANRYGLRFTMENGILVGWDEKL